MMPALQAPVRIRRPVLRYYGGKFRLAPSLLRIFPAHHVYTEAYGGGASVLLQKPRSYAEIYNDLDHEVVNVFRVLQNVVQAYKLERLLRLTPYAREEFLLSYSPAKDPVERGCTKIGTASSGRGAVLLFDLRQTQADRVRVAQPGR
jgi:DNA adenine methylase